METAETSDLPVPAANIGTTETKLSNQLYYMLFMILKGGALTRAIYCGPGEGLDSLEAWRQLARHHERTSLTRAAGLLQELLGSSTSF
eukprot:5424831-Amphidinium_carterae.1